MKAWITCPGGGIVLAHCPGPVEISDYDGGAVIEGAARSSAGSPWSGPPFRSKSIAIGVGQIRWRLT